MTTQMTTQTEFYQAVLEQAKVREQNLQAEMSNSGLCRLTNHLFPSIEDNVVCWAGASSEDSYLFKLLIEFTEEKVELKGKLVNALKIKTNPTVYKFQPYTNNYELVETDYQPVSVYVYFSRGTLVVYCNTNDQNPNKPDTPVNLQDLERITYNPNCNTGNLYPVINNLVNSINGVFVRQGYALLNHGGN